MIRQSALFLMILMVVPACAAIPGTIAASAPPAAEEVRAARELAPQTLTEGECGLFLWTQATPRRLVFFSRAGSNTAAAYVADQERHFSQTQMSGTNFGQFMTEMTFTDTGTGQSVRIQLEPGDVLESGQRTQNAGLFYKDAEGWETIFPVRGVRVCKVD